MLNKYLSVYFNPVTATQTDIKSLCAVDFSFGVTFVTFKNCSGKDPKLLQNWFTNYRTEEKTKTLGG